VTGVLNLVWDLSDLGDSIAVDFYLIVVDVVALPMVPIEGYGLRSFAPVPRCMKAFLNPVLIGSGTRSPLESGQIDPLASRRESTPHAAYCISIQVASLKTFHSFCI